MRRNLSSSKTVVLGVGNTIFSDDGVGVHAARLLKNDARLPADVSVLDGGTLGLELLAYVCDATRVLFLDAVNSGETPGTLSRMTADELLGISSGSNVHQLGVVDLIAAMILVSDAPREIIVLGVQPANTDWGTELSPRIRAALKPLVDAALTELRRWTASPVKSVKAHFRLQGQPVV
jgi:hydrogenase maturation protease